MHLVSLIRFSGLFNPGATADSIRGQKSVLKLHGTDAEQLDQAVETVFLPGAEQIPDTFHLSAWTEDGSDGRLLRLMLNSDANKVPHNVSVIPDDPNIQPGPLERPYRFHRRLNREGHNALRQNPGESFEDFFRKALAGITRFLASR